MEPRKAAAAELGGGAGALTACPGTGWCRPIGRDPKPMSCSVALAKLPASVSCSRLLSVSATRAQCLVNARTFCKLEVF